MGRSLVFIAIHSFSLLWGQMPLKVLSYNLQGMKPGTDSEARLEHIIQELKVLDPDIIGLQEINEARNQGGADNQARRIADSLTVWADASYNYYLCKTHLSWNNQYNEYVGIITKYAVSDSGCGQLATGVFPRGVVWNRITTPIGSVNFFNTHLSYNDQNVRKRQVGQIREYIDQIDTEYPAVATILTGDFNDTPGTPPNALLTTGDGGTFYRDTFAEANPGAGGYTVPASAPNRRIDYIFLKSTGGFSIDSSATVLNQPYSGGDYLSDHLGVITFFSIDTSTVNRP